MKKIILSLFLIFGICSVVLPQSSLITLYSNPPAEISNLMGFEQTATGRNSLFIRLSGNYSTPLYGRILKYDPIAGTWSIPYNGIFEPTFVDYPYNPNYYPFTFFKVSASGTAIGQKVYDVNPIVNVGKITSDDGKTFNLFPEDSLKGDILCGMDFYPGNDSILYSAVIKDLGYTTLFKTTNRGANWEEIYSYSYEFTQNGFFLFNPNNPNYVFRESYFPTGSNESVLQLNVSSNGGATFNPASTFHRYNDEYTGSYKLVFGKDSTVYQLSPQGSSILKSTNYGLNWSDVNPGSGLPNKAFSLLVSPENSSKLYLGTSQGIYISTNSGQNWTLYNNAFPESRRVTGLAKDKNSGDTLYASTSKGVYKVTRSEIIHDTVNAGYLPLQIGNKWIYKLNSYQSMSGGTISGKTEQITGDTTMQGKKYFILSNMTSGYPADIKYIRYDSLTGRVYRCHYNNGTPKESVYLNSSGENGDVFYQSMMLSQTLTDTVFGIISTVKKASSYYSNIHGGSGSSDASFKKGIGLISAGSYYTSNVSGGSSSTILRGAIINGIVFGDTSYVPVIGGKTTINNDSSIYKGYVKAVYYDSATTDLITVDSAKIDSLTGRYIIKNLPPSPFRIMAYQSDKKKDFVASFYSGTSSTTDWKFSRFVTPAPENIIIDFGLIKANSSFSESPLNIGTLSGRVERATDNFALQNSIVYIKFGGQYVNCSVTGEDGSYEIPKLRTGDYEMIIERIGYPRVERNVYLNFDTELNATENFAINQQTGIVTQQTDVTPKSYELFQNYPNPFNPVTRIKFDIPKNGAVTLKVYDIAGREAAVVLNEVKAAGRYEVMFDGSKLASGVYFYRLISDGFVSTKKMILIK